MSTTGPAWIKVAETDELPRVRLELWAQVLTSLRGKVKKGPEATVRGFEFARDARIPRLARLGVAAELDLKVFSWASLGAHYQHLFNRGPRRRIHYEGISLNGRSLAGGTQCAGFGAPRGSCHAQGYACPRRGPEAAGLGP